MTINEIPKDKKIVLYDGVCRFCNASVNYIIKHDKNDNFRFVSMQSALGTNILNHLGISNKNIDSIVVYQKGIAYFIKAEAIFEIVKHFGGVYKILMLFKIIPISILNSIYDYLAKNRYSWFGKNETCVVPSPNYSAKFLE